MECTFVTYIKRFCPKIISNNVTLWSKHIIICHHEYKSFLIIDFGE